MSSLVERLGVGGGGRNIGVTGSLVGASGKLELVGSLEVGIAGSAVGGGVILEIEVALKAKILALAPSHAGPLFLQSTTYGSI